jgi:Transposase DDE domain
MTTPHRDNENVGFLKTFATATIGSRSGSLSEHATLLRFLPGTKGFHRRYERLLERLRILQEVLKAQVQEHLRTLRGLTLAVFDDTPIKKCGTCFEGEGVFFDHVKGTFYDGYTACSTALYRGGKIGVIDVEIAPEKDTKITLFQSAIKTLSEQEFSPDVFLFDAWYAVKPVLDTIEEHHKVYVTRLKSNRIVLYEDERISLRELASSINHEQYTRIVLHGKTYWVVDLVLDLNGLEAQRVLISKDAVFAKPVFLTTNNSNFGTKFVLGLYAKRFAIEVFFKDAKQHLKLETFQCRTLPKWKLHFTLLQLIHWTIQRRNSISKTIRKIRDSVDKITSYINKNTAFLKILDEFSQKCQT